MEAITDFRALYDIDSAAKSSGLPEQLIYRYYTNSEHTKYIIATTIGNAKLVVAIMVYNNLKGLYMILYPKHILLNFDSSLYNSFGLIVLSGKTRLALVVKNIYDFYRNMFQSLNLLNFTVLYWVEGNNANNNSIIGHNNTIIGATNNSIGGRIILNCSVLNLWNKDMSCLEYINPGIVVFDIYSIIGINSTHIRMPLSTQFYMFGLRGKTIPSTIEADVRLINNRFPNLRYFIFVFGEDGRMVHPNLLLENPHIVIYEIVDNTNSHISKMAVGISPLLEPIGLLEYRCRFTEILGY